MFLHDVYGFYNIHEFKNPGENGSLFNGIEYLKPKMQPSNHTLSLWDVIERENIIYLIEYKQDLRCINKAKPFQ